MILSYMVLDIDKLGPICNDEVTDVDRGVRDAGVGLGLGSREVEVVGDVGPGFVEIVDDVVDGVGLRFIWVVVGIRLELGPETPRLQVTLDRDCDIETPGHH